VRELGWIV